MQSREMFSCEGCNPAICRKMFGTGGQVWHVPTRMWVLTHTPSKEGSEGPGKGATGWRREGKGSRSSVSTQDQSTMRACVDRSQRVPLTVPSLCVHHGNVLKCNDPSGDASHHLLLVILTTAPPAHLESCRRPPIWACSDILGSPHSLLHKAAHRTAKMQFVSVGLKIPPSAIYSLETKSKLLPVAPKVCLPF